MAITQLNRAESLVSERYTSLPLEITDEIRDGRVLAGDSLTGTQLAKWFAQEQEAFYEGDAGNSKTDPWYTYMRFLNAKLGFSRIDRATTAPRSILFVGPGSGIEAEAFASENSGWTLAFLEASVHFRKELKSRFPQSIGIEPTIGGDISLESGSQNVVCAFSVLHHIPNVTRTVGEVYCITAPGGLFLVREPCSSMGDWRFPRSATPNERGISRRFLTHVAHEAGFVSIVKPVPVIFNPLNRILKKTRLFSILPFEVIYRIDRALSSFAALNDHYWRDAWYKRLGPSAYFYVFQRPLTQ